MTSVGLALLFVATQPPGTDGGQIRRAFERAYLPMLDAVAAHCAAPDASGKPGLRVSMHWSGALIEWMELHAPDALARLVALVRAGRVEPLGGLYGGALLPALPERDVIGQVQASTRWWQAHADVRPRGAWLPHCGWDPVAARILGRLGVDCTVLEDAQLGVSPEEGFALTEREGVPLAIFGADTQIGAMVPDESPARILRAIDARARAGARLVTLAVPVESFGAAIDASATRCFGGTTTEDAGGWVHAFFRALAEASHWLKLVPFGTALDRMRPRARVYPPASVAGAVALGAMGPARAAARARLRVEARAAAARVAEDAAAPSEIRALASAVDAVAPGAWEPTLALHPEIDRLHKRMLRVSAEVARLRAALRAGGPNGPAPDDPRLDALEDATRALWRGQDAAAYVVGPAVGAQDPAVRHAAWAQLLRAEHVALSALGEPHAVRVDESDYDCDGRPEVLVRTPRLCAIVDPGDGGALVELDAWTLPGNLLNVGTRREEPDHAALRASDRPEDAALVARIQYDRHLRAAFVDHFLTPDATLANILGGPFPEAGDFAGAAYDVLHREESATGPAAGPIVVGLGRDGNVTSAAGLRLVRVLKRFAIARDEARIDVRYEVANRYHEPLRTRFAVELDLGLDGLGPDVHLEIGGPFDATRVDPRTAGEHDEVSVLSLVDDARGWRLQLRSAQPARVWHHPVETVSRAPEGVSVCTQGACLLLWWPVELYGMERCRFDLTLSLES